MDKIIRFEDSEKYQIIKKRILEDLEGIDFQRCWGILEEIKLELWEELKNE